MDDEQKPSQTPNAVDSVETGGDAKPEQPQPQPASPLGGAVGAPKKGSPAKILAIVIAVVLVLGAAGYMLYARQKKDEKPSSQSKVKVGVLLAFSGGSSSMGYGAIKGIELAKKQLGADNIELVQADGKCDPKTAPDAMQYLIDQQVIAVIGENCSSASVAVLPKANENKLVMLSPSASSPNLTIPNDYFFRTVPPDTGQGAFLAEVMFNQGIKRAGVFYTDEPYGTAINKVFKDKFESLGGKVVVTATAPSSVIDVQAQVNQLKAGNPEGLAIVTNSTVSSTAVMKLGRSSGLTIPFFGGDNLYDNTIITNGGTAAEGLKVVSFPTGDAAFKQALFNEYQVTEQLYAAPEAYDAFKAIHMAVQKGATTKEKMKEILPTIEFQGASSNIKFDANGELSIQGYKYDLLEVKDGKFVILEQ